MSEWRILRAYTGAVTKHWWVIITGLGLTILDGVERLLGTWYLLPTWVKIGSAVVGLAAAQYLAYRDLARAARGSATSDFKQRLRHALRSADLRWSVLEKEEITTPQMVCKEINDFCDALMSLYAVCPPELDSTPLHSAIDRLQVSKAFRASNFMGTPEDADKISEQMKSALANVRAML